MILFVFVWVNWFLFYFFFFFNDTATTEIYTLSLHDALPICSSECSPTSVARRQYSLRSSATCCSSCRSEEHTSELQSRSDLVCRLLLEKKKNNTKNTSNPIKKHNKNYR